MAKTNCKSYPSDQRVMGAVLPLIFGTLALIMFVPGFKHKSKVVLVVAILITVAGYKIGKGIKTTDVMCDGDF